MSSLIDVRASCVGSRSRSGPRWERSPACWRCPFDWHRRCPEGEGRSVPANATASALEIENANYRVATEALSGQIQGLQAAIGELGDKAALDPALHDGDEQAPSRRQEPAMGGASPTSAAPANGNTANPAIPRKHLRPASELLQGLESRLSTVRSDVDKRNALAASTPSIWPAHGWLSSTVGTDAIQLMAAETFTRASTFPPIREPRLRDSRWHHHVSGARERLRQSDCHPARIRPRDPLRAPVEVPGPERRQGQARRHHRPRRLDGPLDRLTPPLRSPRQRPPPEPAPSPVELPALESRSKVPGFQSSTVPKFRVQVHGSKVQGSSAPLRLSSFKVTRFQGFEPWNLGTLEPWNLGTYNVGLTTATSTRHARSASRQGYWHSEQS